MFSTTWFWLFITAVLFSGLSYTSHSAISGISQAIGTICLIALFVFAVLGLFFADHWWHGVLALFLAYLISGGLNGIFGGTKLGEILNAIGIIAAPALTVATYIVWF